MQFALNLFSGKPTVERIFFPASESWDPVKKTVSFYAIREVGAVVCQMPFLSLQAIFDARPENVLDTFRAYRRLIESRATFSITTGRFEKDGSVKITTDDFVYGYKS